MDTKELSLKKRELEREIASLIADFSKDTGVSIESVDVTMQEATTLKGAYSGTRTFVVDRVICKVAL